MSIQVLSDEKNPLFNRREVKARLGYTDRTPSRLEIRKELSKELGVREELIIIKRVNPDYGAPVAQLEISIYDDEKALKELEPEHMVNRHIPKEKKEETKKEEAKKEEEKKIEEKKKEKAGEEKPELKEEKKKDDKKEEKK